MNYLFYFIVYGPPTLPDLVVMHPDPEPPTLPALVVVHPDPEPPTLPALVVVRPDPEPCRPDPEPSRTLWCTESNEELSEDQKALVRYQAKRVQDSKKTGKAGRMAGQGWGRVGGWRVGAG